jgi:hypothetical protein
MHIIGIYTITCIANNRTVHIRELNCGRHINKDLQNDWNKYHADNFKFDIIHIVENKRELYEQELYYTNQYQSFNLYNQIAPARHKTSLVDLFCEVCGCSEQETSCMSSNNKHKLILCYKHYSQMKHSGRITDDSKSEKYNQRTPNEMIIHENYAEILNFKRYNKIDKIIIDVDDVEICKRYKWGINSMGYAACCLGKKQTILLHRFLLNPKADECVDHINGVRSDNRRANLRICTKQQNNHNRHDDRDLGIIWDKFRSKWKAIITFNNKQIYLGRFNEKEDAIQARKEAEMKYFKEFAPSIANYQVINL